ncbi:hypothetical protein MFIFM68171_09151 [Madurella fahalii]|uniref:Uncharacterized protein n=1 Tax=Madurella fahalii TaxID=1157608 RepID=A0ABQ0GMJ3_9PEZI
MAADARNKRHLRATAGITGYPDNSSCSDVPRPLYIAKRSVLHQRSRVSRNSRCCSSGSDASDTGTASPPEPPGGKRTLAIPKRRGNRDGCVGSRAVGCGYERRDGKSADGWDHARFEPRRMMQSAYATQSSQLPCCLTPPPSNISDPHQGGNHANRRAPSPLRNVRGVIPQLPPYDTETAAAVSRGPESTSHGSPSAPLCEPCLADSSVLVPRIIVTPEYKALNEGVNALWAAVQLSTVVCPANILGKQQRHDTYCEWLVGLRRKPSSSELSRYGYLYDVSVEISPSAKSIITEVLDDTSRSNSDELMEDLEYRLSGATTEYLEIRVTYRHSGFPQERARTTAGADALPPLDSVASVQTTIQTTAVATIKRHDFASPWSRHVRAPQLNELFEIVASHWGIKRACEVMQRVTSSRPISSRKTSALSPPAILEYSPASVASEERRGERGSNKLERLLNPNNLEATIRPSPPIPKRRASLKHVSVSSPWSPPQQQHPGHRTEGTPDYDAGPSPVGHDAAKSVGAEKRKGSGGGDMALLARRISHRLSRVRRASSTLLAPSCSAVGPTSSSPPALKSQKRKSFGRVGGQ